SRMALRFCAPHPEWGAVRRAGALLRGAGTAATAALLRLGSHPRQFHRRPAQETTPDRPCSLRPEPTAQTPRNHRPRLTSSLYPRRHALSSGTLIWSGFGSGNQVAFYGGMESVISIDTQSMRPLGLRLRFMSM